MNLFRVIILWLTADPRTRTAAESVLRGKAHARKYPTKKGQRGFRMVEGGER